MATKKTKKQAAPVLVDDLVVESNDETTLSVDKIGINVADIKDDWFSHVSSGITTPSDEKINVPKGLWTKCSACCQLFAKDEMVENFFVCPSCAHHHRIPSVEYMNILFDDKKYKLLFENISSVDMLGFKDLIPYAERLKEAKEKTKLQDAMRIGAGAIGGYSAVIAAMDFSFIGGSLGCAVGEKLCLGVEYAIKKKMPFICIPQSGGARMMESAFSLMQMPKAASCLHLLAKARLPYIVLLTDPTYGGVTASFAMLGDIHLAEPKARIGFAGPRVIEELIKKKVPENFQTSEALKENGFVDRIVHRHHLKEEITQLLFFFKH